MASDAMASFTPPETACEEVSGRLASLDLAAETASSAKELQNVELPSDLADGTSTEPSNTQVQTTKVQEVEWSNFGTQGGFGSFSDFLAEFPVDSCEQDVVNALHSNPEADFFQFGEQSTPTAGSILLEQEFDDGSFFARQQPYFQGKTRAADGPFQSPSTVYEPRRENEESACVQSQGVAQQVQSGQVDQSYWQSLYSQGQEQQTLRDPLDQCQQDDLQSRGQEHQSQGDPLDRSLWDSLQSQGEVQQAQFAELDQSPWQEVTEYPGWLYNTLTGEWLEKSIHDASSATVSSLDYSSGRHHTKDPAGDSQTGHVQAQETSGNSAQSLRQTGVAGGSHLGQSLEAVPESDWAGDQTFMSQTNITHNPLFEETVVQESESAWKESSGEVASIELQSGWEDQYPDWYYDHQAQEWKQYSESSQGAATSSPELSEQQPHATPFPDALHDQVSHPNDFPQVYNAAGWSIGQDQRYNTGAQFSQDSHDVMAGALQKDSQSSSHAQSFGQWTDGESQQFVSSSSYYQSGQQPMNGVNQNSEFIQQSWDAPYNAQQVDPQIQSQRLPDIHYNHYGTSQIPRYAPQSWSAGNPYQSHHYQQYAPQTPPKSSEEALRTSVGRPPHVITSFGFGGKLVIMKLKDPLSLQSSDGNQSVASGQAWVPGPVQVHSLSQLVTQAADYGRGESGCLYFGSLGRSNIAGPLVGGSFSTKELSKWLEDRATNCQSEEPNSRSPRSLSMLWGLLKLACQHYGKLRSASGTAGITSQEEDGPEAALAKLLTLGGEQSSWMMGSLASSVCLKPMPSEQQLQVTASEITKLLVAGKRKDALKHAQQGQLWGPALVLARQLGEKYYTDTVAEMAQHQFLPGSPLRTLSLLLAGHPAEVFDGNKTMAAPIRLPMQVPSSLGVSTEDGLGSMLEEWPENLSIMAANRTNGDDRVISHLGDCLWKVKGEVAAAHICYLVADGNFESFSSSARLCLIGADHWKNPRTYATPEAIQRTEVYEYSKVLGNPQYILVPFQPYKIIYASMLAEAGKTAEALRYCQAVLKTLKTASRTLEVETCRQAATTLEERLRFQAQSGHSVNLAPGKLVRGFLSALDRGIHGIIGGPPPATIEEQGQIGALVEPVTLQDHLSTRFGTSPSRPPVPLGPSASAEKLKETGRNMPQRSVSEPDFSATMKEKAEQGKPTMRTGYLGRFGAVFSKAGGIVSMVSKTSKNEAKLGDKNKFYYDENLKRWVEEGTAAPQEEAVLAAPPKSVNFSRKVEDLSPDAQFGVGAGTGAGTPSVSKSAYLGTPPVPPNNQFSARSRQQGVRSRYVDTFNKGGNSTPSKPVVSAFVSAGRGGGSPIQPMNFFVPGSSLESSNGSVRNTDNGTMNDSSEENHVGHYPDPVLNMAERSETSQYSAAQNLFHQSGVVGSMHRVSSSENTTAFGMGVMHGTPSSENAMAFGTTEFGEGSGRLGRSPGNGDIGFSNGYHSRANSWSGYPSNFQNSQTETNSSYDIPATNFSMYNGFSSQSTVNTPPSVGSYFPLPPKVDVHKSNPSSGIIDGFSSPPPSIPPFMAAPVTGELLPGALADRSGSQAAISLVGEDLQEVEL